MHFMKVVLAAAIGLIGAIQFTQAQSGEPIKIGFSMPVTGPLSANGKPALLAMRIWEEGINAKGGLLGRPVKLITYDDQSNPSNVPGIYTKLLEVDRVDLIVGSYGTNLTAPALPVAIQKNKVILGILATAINHEFKYPRYFSMAPAGPQSKTASTLGFFEIAMAQNPKPQTVALAAVDAEFGRNSCDGARDNAKAAGLRIVYDRSYPPTSTYLTPVVRGIQATTPDLLVICSYPLDSVAMIRAISETGFKAKMIGGAMVGPQITAIKTQLGPLLNGIVNFDMWLPAKTLMFPGSQELLDKYQARAGGGGGRSARLFHSAVGVLLSPGIGRSDYRGRKASMTARSRTTSGAMRSKRWSDGSNSDRTASGRSRACCRCSIGISRATTLPSSRT